MLKQRLIWGFPLGALAIAIVGYSDFFLYVTLLTASIWLMIEFFELTGLRTERTWFPMRRWGYFLGCTIMTLVYFNQIEFVYLAIVAFIMAAFIYRMANFHKQTDGFLRELAVSILGGVYIGLFMSYFFRLKHLGVELRAAEVIPVGSAWLANIPLLGSVLENAGWTSGTGLMAQGPNWLILLPFVGSWGYDFSAFFTGRLLGKTKLAPAISPNKTIEGMAGGVIGCGTAMVMLAWWIGVESNYFLFLFALGMILGTFSQLGDLSISSIKREAGAKDSAKKGIPGHGGMFDKCDGLLFVLPVCYYMIYFTAKLAGIIPK